MTVWPWTKRFPPYFVVVVDDQNQLVDFELYENERPAKRAYRSWTAMENGFEWRPSKTRKTFYGRPNLQITIGLLPFRTFHGVSDEELRSRASGYLRYEVMLEAKECERRFLQRH